MPVRQTTNQDTYAPSVNCALHVRNFMRRRKYVVKPNFPTHSVMVGYLQGLGFLVGRGFMHLNLNDAVTTT